MPALRLIAALLVFAGAAQAQVINGQSTDDAAFAPRPAARWHSPEASGAVPDNEVRDERRDRDLSSARPRD